MKRIVGLPSKCKRDKPQPPPPPKPSINDVVQSTDRRTEVIDFKVAECENQLRQINQQMKRADSEAAKLRLRQRAKPILVRKKQLEEQAELSREKSFNLDSLSSSLDSAQHTKIIAGCLKEQTKELKKSLKKLDLDKIEAVQEDLGDLIELTTDVTSAISKNYDVPLDIDDDELNNQLEMLGDEIIRDNDPSYIDAVINPTIPTATPSAGTDAPDGQMQMVDEFGLPILNNTNTDASVPGAEGINPSEGMSHNP